jgi:hypothetical protein
MAAAKKASETRVEAPEQPSFPRRAGRPVIESRHAAALASFFAVTVKALGRTPAMGHRRHRHPVNSTMVMVIALGVLVGVIATFGLTLILWH